MNGSLREGFVLLLGMALLGAPRPASSQTSDRALLDTIAEAWRRREEATRSVETTWEETETIPRDALTNHPLLDRQGKLGDAGKAPYPAADTTLTRRGRVVLDGDRIRYQGERQRLGDKADVWQDRYLSTFDGRHSKTLWYNPRAEAPRSDLARVVLSRSLVARRRSSPV